MATFERYVSNDVTTAANIHTSNASDAALADIIIGFSIANTHATSTATANAYVTVGSDDLYLAKGVRIPAGGAVEILQGKIILDNTDIVKVSSDIAVDVWLSVLDNAEVA